MSKAQRLYFKIPKIIVSNFDGFEFLCYLSIKTYNSKDLDLVFDFSDTVSFDYNLCASFGALIGNLRSKNNSVNLVNINPEIKEALKSNGFYELIDSMFSDFRHEATAMDFRKFTLQDTASFQEYINDQLLSKRDFPHLSELLKKKINKSILELFNNAHVHGACEFVYTCGQYFEADSRLKFTMADMGMTIRKNVNLYFNSGNRLSGQETIEWAVEEGNTTKKGNIPGGLGLSLIRDFLKLNEGQIQIISSNGYWEEKNGITFGNAFKNRFLGTIVNLEFNLNDSKSYVLTSEIDPKNVL